MSKIEHYLFLVALSGPLTLSELEKLRKFLW